jgi:uncharacterized protein (DUF2461 family)
MGQVKQSRQWYLEQYQELYDEISDELLKTLDELTHNTGDESLHRYVDLLEEELHIVRTQIDSLGGTL